MGPDTAQTGEDKMADSQPDTTAQQHTGVAKLGYLGFTTPDVDRMVSYYTDVLSFELVERSSSAAFLTTNFDHHCVVLEETDGDAEAMTFVGYEVRGSLDSAEQRLKNAGCQTERRSDFQPGMPETLVVREPSGTELHLYDVTQGSAVTSYPPLRPTKLGHVASYTSDLAGTQDFYQDLLGFRWSDTIGDFFVFLRCNADHHTANFLHSDRYRGMHHVAFEMRDLNHLQMMLDNLAANDYRLIWGPGRHGPGHNIFTYHRDPDGNIIELFTQLDLMLNEERGYFEPRPWHEDLPQFPKIWNPGVGTGNKWGPLSPEVQTR